MKKQNKQIFLILFLFIICVLFTLNSYALTSNERINNNSVSDDGIITCTGSSTLAGKIIIFSGKVAPFIGAALILFSIYKIIKAKKENKKCTGTVIRIVLSVLLFMWGGLVNIISSFAMKPIIYLYPEHEQIVTVELGNPELLTTSYPKYNEKWNVLAKPNGDLKDLDTNRNLYALYWEGKIENNNDRFDEGFCIKGDDIASFLEEKLALLGLNEREAEEFIVYWLPILEGNKYNLIRFKTQEEINDIMPLNIDPEPDTVIRVLMQFKGANKYIEIPEQKIVTPERTGFVVVEWGGTEVK